MASRRILSGIQPSGFMHIGNYLGAIKNWVAMQGPGSECFYCVVDYHSITNTVDGLLKDRHGKYDPKAFSNRSLNLALDVLATGVDPDKSALFLQSQVPEHTELSWLLSAVSSVGDLERMTQYKDRAIPTPPKELEERLANAKDDKEKNAIQAFEDRKLKFVSAAFFTYPVLMAADILAYKATHIPVGEDQDQHLEQASDIAKRFNHHFGDTFPDPKAIKTAAPKIQSLSDPTKKMSKSDTDEKGCIGVFEDEASIRKKIKSAVTAKGDEKPTESLPGVDNLLQILREVAPAAVVGPLEAAAKERTLKYSELKDAVANQLLESLKPIREKRASLSEKYAREVLAAGGERARKIARATVAEARDRIGFFEVE